MIKQLREWFNKDTPSSTPMPSNLATAALLIEVMAADDEWSTEEESTVKQLLIHTLNIEPDQANTLFQEAKNHQQNAHDLYELTQTINNQFSPEQKFNLIVSLWQVAYADGNLDRFEDHIIRKIAELIYVSHSDFIRAKLSAQPED